jgi:hypothetical protein
VSFPLPNIVILTFSSHLHIGHMAHMAHMAHGRIPI